MTTTGHWGLVFSMTLLLLPFSVRAQNPFSYLPLNTAPVVSEAVDIVVEPQTYTPAFYQGRAEPIAGARVKLTAIAHSEISLDSLTYRWYVNDQALEDAPKATDQTVTVTAPINPSFEVKVAVFSDGGKFLASKSETIFLGKPILVFYENNLLRGQNEVAIAEDLIMLGDEVTITAIPYFINPDNTSAGLKTFWEIDGIEQTTTNPWEITLERTTFNRDVMINFFLQNYQTLAGEQKGFTLKI